MLNFLGSPNRLKREARQLLRMAGHKPLPFKRIDPSLDVFTGGCARCNETARIAYRIISFGDDIGRAAPIQCKKS